MLFHKRYADLCILLLCAQPFTAQAEQIKTYFYSGTGFFVNRDGYVLTNAHVINNCQRILLDGAEAKQEASLVVRDPEHDLALLKADITVPDTASLRSVAHPLKVGDRMIIAGYPGDASRTGTLVSREAEIVAVTGPTGEEKWLQLNNVVEQGNSGGPLLDSAGNVSGVVTARAEIYSYMSDQPNNGTTRNAGIAITLPTVEHFLDIQHILYQQSDNEGYLSLDRISDMARRYVVNVRCEYKTERQ